MKQSVVDWALTINVIIAVVSIGVVIGTDAVLGFNTESGDTYSEVTRNIGRFSPVSPWIWGLFAGRFFHWRTKQVFDAAIKNAAVLILATIAIILLGFAPFWGVIAENGGMSVVFVAAFFMGVYFWPIRTGGIFLIRGDGKRARR